jgi:pimeloyl-ACP methyl ester carboxylesterase
MPTIDTGEIALFFTDAGTAGPPILLLHELGGSSESWSQVIPHLAPHRRTIAVDLRCAGRSEKPPGPFAMRQLADDLAQAFDAPQFDVIGAALGSLVGALLAIHHPHRVRKLMMCAVAPDMAGPTRDYLTSRAGRVRTVGMRGVADASLANSFPESHAQARAAYRGIYLANDPNAYAELSLALARLDMTPADWARVAAPTLVAPGAQDFLWPPPVGRQVADLVPGAHCEVLTEAGHFPHLQAPEQLARMAMRFLSG